nr:hypothetical protein [uncultured Desulfobulbus sp.]
MYNTLKIQLFLALLFFLALPLGVGAEENAPAPRETPPAVAQAAPETVGQAAPVKEESFTRVELDTFIELEKHAAEKGKKLIKMARPVSFDARMKRLPEERQVTYVYKALELSGVSPLPEINHRMFVESSGGRIIPVYVEKNAVLKLNAGLKEEEKAHFLGYHVYSYAKGPAILVVDFSAIP